MMGNTIFLTPNVYNSNSLDLLKKKIIKLLMHSDSLIGQFVQLHL
ncbi:hypothetical protein GFK82_00545 [Candidatus Steffania adelgidicola]|nr:hypothetical protein GFK82_00545 [Candidatus Steffania adelgidicola]